MAPPDPPVCQGCGVVSGADHTEKCSVLTALRAQWYPLAIDQNGSSWYVNSLKKRDEEIERLRAAIAAVEAARRV